MKHKATSITALAMAAAVAIAPVSNAVAATSLPTTPAASGPTTPAAVLKNIAAAPAVANSAASVAPTALGTFVVVTDEAVAAAPTATGALSAAAAPVAAADKGAVELAGVPKAVTDILNTAGLPVQAVYRVLQTSQGVYTIWYKMLTSVPQAIFKGEFGSVPTLFQKAISDSLTWIATGAGPKVPETPKTATTAATETAAAVSPVSAALDVLGIPVATAYAAGQAGLSIYQSFYGLLTSVPQAIFQGKFGDAAGLVVDAVAKSITTIVDFPGAQLKAASDKITKLVTALTPAPTAPTAATDVRALSLTSAGEVPASTALLPVTTGSGDQKASDTQKPVERTLGLDAKPTVEAPKPAETKPVAIAPAETTASKPVVEPTKPADGAVVPSAPTESKPASGGSTENGSSPAAESKPASDAKPTVESKTSDSKPTVATATDSTPTADRSSVTEAKPTAERSTGADEKPTASSSAE
ncbi:hypothetical protein [Tsukamurella pseudospumae]|uniref:PE-PGRS family protein n=1 Tax=Tsukamurella pseudospumae TaxID=239498 RepID=A0A137ZZY0_9ACTN|nr:hypothetical protein [Tsukamurella pseudospumae]KXP03745.1 hypothetical protein AXK60_18300 [Tsukamurella pseudospumae]